MRVEGQTLQLGRILLLVVLPLSWIELTSGAARPVGAGRDGGKMEAITVYQNDFEEQVGAEWSHNKIDITPRGGRKFLGQFGNDNARLTLKDLPQHAFVRLSFELFIIRTWDGSCKVPNVGPDVWILEVKNGPRLLHATLANGALKGCDKQSFPDSFPGPLYERRTGAAEVETLGYSPQIIEKDSVYRMTCCFPHSRKELTLIFSALGLESLGNESWGLDNIKVEVFPSPPGVELPAKKLKQLWSDLVGEDPIKAHKGLWALVGAGDRVIPLLKDHLNAQRASVERLIAQLDHKEWSIRERASKELKARRSETESLLHQTLQTTDSPEVRWRIQAILKAWSEPQELDFESVRYSRIVHLLEVVASAKARSALQNLATNAPTPAARSLAETALQRLHALSGREGSIGKLR